MEKLTTKQEEKALELIAQGESFEEVAIMLGLLSAGQLATYRKHYPEFNNSVYESRQIYCEHLEKRLLEIPHMYDVNVAKLLSANIIKFLEYNNRDRYAPRQQHDINVTLDISGALERAKRRVIDVSPTNVLPMKMKEIE